MTTYDEWCSFYLFSSVIFIFAAFLEIYKCIYKYNSKVSTSSTCVMKFIRLTFFFFFLSLFLIFLYRLQVLVKFKIPKIIFKYSWYFDLCFIFQLLHFILHMCCDQVFLWRYLPSATFYSVSSNWIYLYCLIISKLNLIHRSYA